MDRIPEDVAKLTVLDPEGGPPRRLEELWSGRTAVLAFVRHFG